MDVCGSEKGGDEASNRVVCGSRSVLMHEMWKRKQVHEDARKMYRTKIILNKFGNYEEDDIWEVMTRSEEWTDRERS